MRVVKGPKASPTGSEAVADLSIVLDREPPPFEKSKFPLGQAAVYYRQRARAIVKALLECAPGGLVDAIFAELAHEKATLFRVAHKPKGGR